MVPPSCGLPRARQSIVSLSVSAPLKILERHRWRQAGAVVSLAVAKELDIACLAAVRHMSSPVGLVPHSRLLVTAARGRGRDDHPRVRTADP